MEARSAGSANAGNLSRYDSDTMQYVFNWQTKGLTHGQYQIRLDLGDGFSYTVQVELR